MAFSIFNNLDGNSNSNNNDDSTGIRIILNLRGKNKNRLVTLSVGLVPWDWLGKIRIGSCDVNILGIVHWVSYILGNLLGIASLGLMNCDIWLGCQ